MPTTEQTPSIARLEFDSSGFLTNGTASVSVTVFDQNADGQFAPIGLGSMDFEDGLLMEVRLDDRPYSALVGDFGVSRFYLATDPQPTPVPGIWMMTVKAVYFGSGRFLRSVNVGATVTRVADNGMGPITPVSVCIDASANGGEW